MTEDDTFKVLSRPGVVEMRERFVNEFLYTTKRAGDYTASRAAFFASYKWDVDEFWAANAADYDQLGPKPKETLTIRSFLETFK